MINIGDQLRHSQLGECDDEVLLNLMMDGPDHRDLVDDALFSGSEGKEVFKALILEVGLVKDPKWGVDIKVAVEGNGEVGVMEVSSHVAKFIWGRGVYVEAVCIQGNIHQHDRASGSGSGGTKGK